MKQGEDINNNSTNDSKSLTISELAKRHQEDLTHTTTDEEMRNAKLELSENVEVDRDMEKLAEVDNTTVIPAMSFEKSPDDDTSSKKGPGDGTSPFPNPYDVLK